MRKYSKNIIAIVCLIIVIFRLFFPKLNFDLISLSLITIATLALLINGPENILEKTKKIKIGSFEWELQELNKETEKIEEKITTKKKPVGLSGPATIHFPKSQEISNDYEYEILKLSMNIEKTLRDISDNQFTEAESKPLAVMKLIENLKNKNVIDMQTFDMLMNFWNIRNSVIHNHNVKINKQDYLSLTDIGLRIVKILEAIKCNSLNDGLKHYGLA